MKKILFLLITPAFLGIQSCEKDDAPGDNYHFDQVLPPYVALSSKAKVTAQQGTSVNFTFQLRTSLQQPVTVIYSVSGAFTLSNKTVVIERDKTSAIATVAIPANIIAAPNTKTSATLSIVSASTADGKALTIGQKNKPADEKVPIEIVL